MAISTITPASLGGVPAFSAYQSSGQSITSGNNKVTFDTEQFDTNNNFSSSRFTPTVAGYYQLNAFASCNWGTLEAAIYLYKNGSPFQNGLDIKIAGAGSLNYGLPFNSLVYANGTTDYFEIYVFTEQNKTMGAGSSATYFNGCMVRGA